MKTMKMTLMGLLGAGVLAIPLAMPSTAQADDLRISLNLGGGSPVYYSQPAPVVHKVVYREAPRRVVVKEVYRPAPRRVVYKDVHRGRGHGRGHGNHYAYGQDRGRWDNHDRYVAWR